MTLVREEHPIMFSWYVFASSVPEFDTFTQRGNINLGFIECAVDEETAVEDYKHLYDHNDAVEYAAVRADRIVWFKEKDV